MYVRPSSVDCAVSVDAEVEVEEVEDGSELSLSDDGVLDELAPLIAGTSTVGREAIRCGCRIDVQDERKRSVRTRQLKAVGVNRWIDGSRQQCGVRPAVQSEGGREGGSLCRRTSELIVHASISLSIHLSVHPSLCTSIPTRARLQVVQRTSIQSHSTLSAAIALSLYASARLTWPRSAAMLS